MMCMLKWPHNGLFLLLDDPAGDNKQEINQFLQYVKKKFSELLLPAEVVTKSDFLGKGMHMNKLPC